MAHSLLKGLVVAAMVAGCSDSTEPSQTATVQVDDNFFNPSSLTVAVGATVKWEWVGNQTHNVVFVGGTSASPDQSSGSWSRTFDTPGPFTYRCTRHNGMTGTITAE